MERSILSRSVGVHYVADCGDRLHANIATRQQLSYNLLLCCRCSSKQLSRARCVCSSWLRYQKNLKLLAGASSVPRTINSERTMLLADAITASQSSEALLSPGEQKLLYELASQVPQGGTIVELGSWMGGSTIMLAAGSQSGPQAKVYAVDAFTIVGENALEYTNRVTGAGLDYLATFRSNIQRAGVESLVEPIRSLTLPAAAAWKGPAINLLFIDASHYYEDVARDFAAWAIHCAHGSSCVFHDYALLGAPGVKKFVDRAIARGLLADVKFVDTIAHGKITTTDPRPSRTA